MIGPVSGTGRAMMASLQQAIQKGMPPDQAVQYVKSMATQGVAPLTDLYAMMNQFQRMKQQPVQAPQTPPTIRDQLNMAEQQQAQQQMAMQQGLGGLPAPAMEQAQFAGGGIVAFQDGGEVNPISYMQRLIREALARGDTETAEEIRASLEDYTSLGRNIPRLNIPTRSEDPWPRCPATDPEGSGLPQRQATPDGYRLVRQNGCPPPASPASAYDSLGWHRASAARSRRSYKATCKPAWHKGPLPSAHSPAPPYPHDAQQC